MLKIEGYLVDMDYIESELVNKKAEKVLIQAPDGLKRLALRIGERLEGMGFQIIFSGEHTWGGCDVAFEEARIVGADTIVHIGHHGPVRVKMPPRPRVIFVPAYYSYDPTELVLETLERVSYQIGGEIVLGSTVQHIIWLDRILQRAREKGLRVKVNKGIGGFNGLVVGCDYRAVKGGKAVVVIAGGIFHGLGAALWSGKPTWVVDPYQRLSRKIDTKKVLSRHLFDLSRTFEAETFLIVVSTKEGQLGILTAEKVRKILRERGKRGYIAVFDEISREKLTNIGRFDAYVNTACPRLTIDDPDMFPGPVLNPGELKYVLRRSLEGYQPRDLFLASAST